MSAPPAALSESIRHINMCDPGGYLPARSETVADLQVSPAADSEYFPWGPRNLRISCAAMSARGERLSARARSSCLRLERLSSQPRRQIDSEQIATHSRMT